MNAPVTRRVCVQKPRDVAPPLSLPGQRESWPAKGMKGDEVVGDALPSKCHALLQH